MLFLIEEHLKGIQNGEIAINDQFAETNARKTLRTTAQGEQL